MPARPRPPRKGPWNGVDGCRAGWIRARLDASGGVDLALVPDARALVADPGELLLIDMPIGLFPSGRARARACDEAARRRLGPRRASVFAPPTRAMLGAREHGEVGPLGLSIQAFHIARKIAEVDRALAATLQRRVREGHPEVAFACLAGRPLAHPKRRAEGRRERLALLEEALPGVGATYDAFIATTRRAEVARDDVIDALVLAVGARDAAAGRALVLPEEAPRDRRGLRMEIVGAAPRAGAPLAMRPVDPHSGPATRGAGRSRRGAEDVRRRERREWIYATVDDIPRGRVASYGQVAEVAGLPGRARLVGRCLGELPPGRDLPWWRVVDAAGSISPRGDGSSAAEQRRRLRAEGVAFDRRGRVDLAGHRWCP